MFVGTKIHTGDELDRLEPVPHPKKPLSIAVRSARTPKWAEGYQAINWSAPAPTPTAPKAPTAPDRPSDDAASGAVEHKDKGTGCQSWTTMMCRARPSPRKAPAAAKPKKDREAPEEQAEGGPGGRQPGPPHEAKEAAEAKGSDDAPGGRQAAAPAQAPGPSGDPPRRRTRAAAPEPKAKAERKRPGRPTRTTSRRPLAKHRSPVVDLVNAYLARHPPPPTPLAK
ncbi:hypothetical protein PAPYR_13218 [Paratrimastix pyriformis]|uniref:Uncharacterized protein n=1 Tax=Paratrimastix pyriformis TaxID=342808 RepID=A0ABQ8U2Z0_9EUKA|nr:hypothetical protein PAPYR_13218 [Paratrimastix pyriformis]